MANDDEEEFANVFSLDVTINDDKIHIEVSGYDDPRNALAALYKMPEYVPNLWSALVDGNWDDE